MAAIEISLGNKSFKLKTLASFKQYTTSSPNTAGGKTVPRYVIYFGVGLFAGNNINGKNLVSIVAKTTIAIVIICSAVVM